MSERPAIVGIGQTEYSRRSGRSELAMAIEAISNALDDAGVPPSEVDGVVRYTYESSAETDLARNFGWVLRHHEEIAYGGLATAAVIGHAAAAIAAGLATTVVCYRSINGRSGVRLGRSERSVATSAEAPARTLKPYAGEHSAPYGLLAPGQMLALRVRRYALEFGIDEDTLAGALGTICVTQRENASRNPAAVMRDKPLALAEYRSSRMISSPLHVHDYTLETDGACAVVVTTAARARDLRRKPVEVLASEQRIVPHDYPTSQFVLRSWDRGWTPAADGLFARAGIDREDVDVACFYEAASPMVLWSLEELGLCGWGEAPAFVLAGETKLGGKLPVNTHGGHLAEAYVHGLNHVVEAVRQLRGEAMTQVPNARVAVVHVSIASGSSVVLGTP